MTSSPEPPEGAVTAPPGYRVGDWEITGFLAAGSWGSVHLARRAETAPGEEAQEVAVKFLTTSGLAPRQARALAETATREVAFSRAADHPGLIRVIDTALIADPSSPMLDGAVVLVMERAALSLLDHLRRTQDERLSSAVQSPGLLLVQIAEALAYLHESGWVHGDLKPANVLLMADGSARLADFGLVARIEGTHGYAPPMGSPDYLPPERNREQLGERGVITRPATDIWAFGVTAYQVLTGGTFPFPGATPAARAAAVQEYGAGRTRLAPAREISPAWQAALASCLEADPVVRAQNTMDTLLPRIRAAAHETAPAPRRSVRRVRRILGIGVPAVALAAAAVAYSGVFGPADPKDAAAEIRVYNMDGTCKQQTERLRACSLGLARDPHRKYDADNVVAQRVWHGDVLKAECVVNDGDRVEDEEGIGTPRWFRVRLDGGADSHGWLPAVRTRDDVQVPIC